ncbi:MAG: glycosyltransferase [Pseudomonadota bacterium]|nr:glycosyltransferase [Pseudomonadota bacterium]
MAEILDIVVPVYRGEAETRACLESVLAAATRRPFEVVVIDDASPEPAISAWLRALAATGRITLIAHDDNRGFVASVNEGMRLHPARDVVLLNSDTEVASGWLDRLWAHFAADASIGTATPFSTNATICSYPRTLAANTMPPGETTTSLDRAFAAANAGRRVDIPTAVGFCMAISRRALDRVGLFDVERYGAGYGEEVDFCMRAARAGFRNVLAGDVFVMHVGEVSFGGTGAERRLQAQATVDALYPEFQQRLAVFLPGDPPRMLRRRADLERLRRAPGEMLLHAVGDRITHLEWPRPGEEFALWLDLTHDAERFAQLIAAVASRAGPIPELDERWLVPPAEGMIRGHRMTPPPR